MRYVSQSNQVDSDLAVLLALFFQAEYGGKPHQRPLEVSSAVELYFILHHSFSTCTFSLNFRFNTSFTRGQNSKQELMLVKGL